MNYVTPCPDCLTVNISKVACPGGCLMKEEDPDHFISKLSHTEDYIIGIYLIILALMGCVLNGLVIIATLKQNGPLNQFEVLLVNICLVDLLQSVCAYPLDAVSNILHRWLYGYTGCKAYAFLVFFFSTCSMGFLTLLSALRYIKTCHAYIGQHIGKVGLSVCLVLCYISGAVWAGAPLLGWGQYAVEEYFSTCTLDWASTPHSYFWSMMVLGFLIPCFVMAWSYTNIAITAYRSTRATGLNNKRQTQITKLAVVMVLGYIIAWTPYATIGFIITLQSSPHLPYWITVLAPLVAKSSTTYNPIIYYLMVKRFRQRVRELFICLHVRLATDETQLTVESTKDQQNNSSKQIQFTVEV